MLKKCLTVIFSLFVLLVSGLIFSACGSSVDVSSVKSAEDTERKMGVEQYKPAPEPKPEPKPTSQEPTRKTTETKSTMTTSTPEPKNATLADVPSFSKVAPESRFKFTEKYKENKEQGKYTSSNYYTSYSYYDFGNFGNDSFYKDSSGVAENFVNLLVTKYPFKLSTHFVIDRTGSDGTIYPEPFYEEEWCLDYTGSKNIKKHWDYDKHINEIYGHVFVIRKDKISSNSGISREYRISISDGLTYEDNEKNPEASAPISGDNSSSFDYPSCPEMRNAADEIKDRMCFRCDGRGYIEEFEYYNGPRYGEPPPPGVSVKKTCPDCNGRGRIELNW